jgi:hypothetical protein
MIAKDLYRLTREVEAAEKKAQTAPSEERHEIKEKLRKLRAERDRLQKILEGAKAPPEYRQPL